MWTQKFTASLRRQDGHSVDAWEGFFQFQFVSFVFNVM